MTTKVKFHKDCLRLHLNSKTMFKQILDEYKEEKVLKVYIEGNDIILVLGKEKELNDILEKEKEELRK